MFGGREFGKIVLNFIGSRNCLFCIVSILRDGGTGVRFIPEVRSLLSPYASVPSMGPHIPLFSRYWDSLPWGNAAES